MQEEVAAYEGAVVDKQGGAKGSSGEEKVLILVMEWIDYQKACTCG